MAGFFASAVLFIVGFLSLCTHAEPMIIFGCFISSGLFYVGMQIWQIVYYIEKRDKIKEQLIESDTVFDNQV